MRLPITWLKDYVDFDDTVEGLADKLTFSGTEVEAVETVGGDYAGLVVGEVRAVQPHPNADKLKLCTVFDGQGESVVVCGAPAVEIGAKYPFAPLGAVLPDGMKIKRAEIRGEVSEGMLCAEDELNLSDDHSGLLKLPADAVAGAPLADVLGPPETVLVVEITPNRPDCLSIMGMAREVAALYNTQLKRPDVSFAESGEETAALTRVDVEDARACPRYTARIIRDVTVGPSPEWMRNRLKLAGLRPINNIVDITNFVLMESGHPLHAFDQSLLNEGRIVVRHARANEHITTLDDIERSLRTNMLVIADADAPVAVAGVMGGAGSEIRDTTSTVLLESACFDASSIRHTSKELGLNTDSSYRFSRGVSLSNAEWSSRRAAALMAEWAGGKPAQGMVDVYPEPYRPSSVTCRRSEVQRLLGIDISAEEIGSIFQRLEIPFQGLENETCTVEAPDFRLDISREVDLIEEVARIHGLSEIPAPPPRAEVVPDASDAPYRARARCRERLTGLGFTEIMNYSLTAPELLDRFNMDDAARRIILPHPISMDQSVLRTALLPQMAESLGYNYARQVRRAAFFECGRVFERTADAGRREIEHMALGLMGDYGRYTLDERKPLTPDEVFLRLKGALEQLAAACASGRVTLEHSEIGAFENEFSASVLLDGAPIGCMGILSSEIAGDMRFQTPVALAEIELLPVIARMRALRAIRPVPVYPAVERDVALIVKKSVKYADIIAVIEELAPEDLENVRLFDIFTGKSIPDDSKSMALALTYRSSKKTLTDEEANEYHENVKDGLKVRLQAEIRDR